MSAALVDELEIWGFEKDFIIFTDGSLGFGLRAKPLNVDCWTDEAINGLNEQIKSLLNGLPSGLDIQFAFDVKSGNQERLENHKTINAVNPDELVQTLTAERLARVKDQDTEGLAPSVELFIFVRKKPRDTLFKKANFLKKRTDLESRSSAQLRDEVYSIDQTKLNVIEAFSSLGIQITEVSPQEILELVYRQWNPDRHIGLADVSFEDVREQLVFTDLVLSEMGFSLGRKVYRLISLKLLPDFTFAGMTRSLAMLPIGTRLLISIEVPDQQSELTALKLQRRIAYSMVAGKKTGLSDVESQTKLGDLETLLEEMVAQGEKVFNMSFQILIEGDSELELDQKAAMSLMKIRELSGAEGLEETVATFDVFKSIALPNARATERLKKVKTSTLSDLLPIYGPWQGHEKARILLRDRSGSVVGFDPFDSKLTNYNQIVSGGSGSGKSYFTNILMLQMLGQNPRVFIVDIGASYKKICENLGGQYIELGISELSVNPFDLGNSEARPDSSKIKFLVGLVEMMTKEDGESGLKKLDRTLIEEAIEQVYEKSNTPSLSILRDILATSNEVSIRLSLAEIFVHPRFPGSSVRLVVQTLLQTALAS